MAKKRTDSESVKLVSKRTQFKSGKDWTGNANGRPVKAKCVSSLLYDLFMGDPEKVMAGWPVPWTGAMHVANALYNKMAKGDLTAINIGLDRAEGKVPTPLAVSGDDTGIPIKITYVPVKEEKDANL